MTETIATAATVATADPHPLKRLLRTPSAVGAATFLLLVTVACLCVGLVSSQDPLATNLSTTLQRPSFEHLLGTDQLGRDILSRLFHGGRLSLFYAAVVTAVALLVGIVFGLAAGFIGGWTDRIISTAADIGLTVPIMVLVIVVMSVFKDYYFVAMVLFGLLLAPPVIRNIRGPVIAVRRELYVDAARVAGSTTRQILVRHVFPRVLGPVLVQVALISSMALLFTVGLSYLGFGPEPPEPTWGSMVAEASQVLGQSSSPLIVSGGLVGLVILSLSVLGDALRDASVESWTGSVPNAKLGAVSRPAQAPEHDTTALLNVRGLGIAFDRPSGTVLVADDLDFSIAPAEIVGLVGESGCGKTAVARSLLRLLPGTGHVVAGEIMFDGRAVLEFTPAELTAYRGATVSYVAQEPMASLDPTCRVGDTLLEVIRAHSDMSRREARLRALEVLAQVKLPEPERVFRLYPHEMSGGMAQRVSIARALAARPRLIVADEPTTALDATVQAGLLDLLRQLRDETGVSILLVSHDLGVVSELCDRAMVMYAGQLVEVGLVDSLINTPVHPYTRGLAACQPTGETRRENPLPAIGGNVPQPGEWLNGCRFADRCDYRIDACTVEFVPLTSSGPDGGENLARAVRCIRQAEFVEIAKPGSVRV